MLFEHKLDSPLGRSQLERYLALCQTRGQKLALVAASSLQLEASVCGSPWFVRPREAGAPAHFLWQDVHQIVRSFPDRIARDFAEFLEAFGLAHFDWAGRGDPYTLTKRRESFALCTMGSPPCFAHRECRASRRPTASSIRFVGRFRPFI